MPAGLTSPVHLFVITVVALIVLGPEKLPHALRQFGRTMGEVRRWSASISSEVQGVLSLDTDDGPRADARTALAPPAPTLNGEDAAGDAVPSRGARLDESALSAGGPGTNGNPFLHPALQEGGEWQ